VEPRPWRLLQSRRGGSNLPTVVRKKAGQSDDKLIADFRKKVISDEILIELKQREFYRKPSIIKQEKIKERRRGRRRPVISYQNKK
jgi:ribosomal protein S21